MREKPDAFMQEIRKQIAALPQASVFSPNDFSDLVEGLTGSDLAYFISRGTLARMAADGEIFEIGGNLFVDAIDGRPPPAAEVVRSYGRKAGYAVEADDETGTYRTAGPSLKFAMGNHVIDLEHDPKLVSPRHP